MQTAMFDKIAVDDCWPLRASSPETFYRSAILTIYMYSSILHHFRVI